MIRPFTCLAFLLACASGLYLYQSKHRATLLDDQITQTVRSTDALREQIRMLSAEWTLLNDPERLRQLATQFLTRQTVSPNQFTSLADLDSRLPPPVPPGAPVSTAAVMASAQMPASVGSEVPGRTGAEEGREANGRPADAKGAETTGALKDAASHGTPAPASAGAAPPAAHVAATNPADQSHPADAKLPISRVASVVAAPPRPAVSQPHGQGAVMAEARPTTLAPHAPIPAPTPPGYLGSGGSFLGMAHDTAAPPLPRPMPVSSPPPFSYSSGG